MALNNQHQHPRGKLNMVLDTWNAITLASPLVVPPNAPLCNPMSVIYRHDNQSEVLAVHIVVGDHRSKYNIKAGIIPELPVPLQVVTGLDYYPQKTSHGES